MNSNKIKNTTGQSTYCLVKDATRNIIENAMDDGVKSAIESILDDPRWYAMWNITNDAAIEFINELN